MRENSELLEQYQEMRRAAERQAAMQPEVLHAMSPEEFIHTIHELQVHQIELEMQNENLRAVHSQLAAAEARYFDLYDLAPVGYLSVSKEGVILESNLTADTLLGVPRSGLNKRPISQFIFKDDQDIYYRHRQQLLGTSEPQQCELRMLKGGEKPFWARLEETLGTERGGKPVCRLVLSDISERKRLEQALADSMAHLQAIVETEPECVKIVSPAGTLLEMNSAGLKMIEAESLARAQSRPLIEFVAPEHQTAFRELLRCVIQGRSGTLEFVSVGLRGGRRWLESHAVPLRDPHTGDTNLLSVTRDITERKQAEVALLALSARQKAILAAVPDIIMEVDVNKVYTWANQAGIEFFGEDVLGKQADSYFEGEQHTYGVVQPLFNGNETVIYVESWQRRRDGEKRLLAWCCRVLKDSSGNVTGALSSALDITERKQIEEKLQESEKKFRSFFELTADLVAIADIEGHFRQINPAWSKTFGYSNEELLAKPFMDFIHPDDKERTRQVIAEKLKRGETVLTFENRYIRKDGSVVWLEWTSHPDTAKGCVFAIARDVTARKQAEERIRQLARHLETVREEEHKRFADELHDELGQILTAIKIDLATVAAECPAEGRLKTKIVGVQKLLADGVLGVHTLCRELRPGALDDLGLKEALDGLTADWKPRTDVKCVFSADIDEEVLTDKIRTAVFRIVQEALTNVSNHAQASQVEVNLVADECILHFSVADNGRGMAPGAESKPETFGLLGMRERLEALGGELHIESSPGKGTHIEGAIPLLREE